MKSDLLSEKSHQVFFFLPLIKHHAKYVLKRPNILMKLASDLTLNFFVPPKSYQNCTVNIEKMFWTV